MRKFHFFAVIAATVLFSACEMLSPYDDSEIKGRVDDLESRITVLETQVARMNSDISAMQAIVTALQAKVYVSNVETTADGYRIIFSNYITATISNGRNGADAPAIGIAQHTDGVYYWTTTINGTTDWLLDADGNKLRVTGENGTDGANGITPQVKVDADGYWCVSYDGGTNFARIVDGSGNPISAFGKDGQDGDSSFKTVTQDNDYVYFTLIDGEVIKIAKGGTETTSEIIYTTVSGNILMPSDLAAFGADMVSNTYNDGRGVITFDKPLKYIGAYAFYHSDDLKTITLPEGIQQIGLSAFKECPLLTITIPNSVTSIGNAFFFCWSLEIVYCKPTTVPSSSRYVFGGNASDRKIYVPNASVAAYKAAEYWSDYADDIVGHNF